MKIIILAAGTGTRLRPYTDNLPKCMVPLAGKPLLHHQLEAIQSLGIDLNDISIVGGYLQDALDAPGIKQYRNNNFDTTNMVETLFCAEEFMTENEDLFIAYGDIVYKPSVFKKLIDTEGDLVIVSDLDWEKLWSLRMNNPLDDAETFILNDKGFVQELGKKPKSKIEVQAQYIGLIKVAAQRVQDFKTFYHGLDRNELYDGRPFKQMFMTSFIQALINEGWKAKPAFINNGWIEVDTVDDLKMYESLKIALIT